MANDNEALLLQMSADVRSLQRSMDRAAGVVDSSTNRMERRAKQAAVAIERAFSRVGATVASGVTVAAVTRLADQYTSYTNTLKVAGLEGDKLARTQDDLFAIAQRYGIELESIGTLYSRATTAARDLGASEAELLQFTNGVGAALKVQGGSAAQSSGALLQLSQALGGGVVRAEEFNSIMEGARPIAQAVADGIDRFGGSVSKLRTEIADGKVTSQEFFQGVLQGSKALEEQASKANLTIVASFTVLNNALGKYIGEADQSLSATEKLSGAIIALSENLDTVAGVGGAIAAILGGRFAAGLLTSAAAAGGLRVALLSAFGGPVGIAITAAILAVGSLAGVIRDAQKPTAEVASLTNQLGDAVDDYTKAAIAAAGATGEEKKRLDEIAASKRQDIINTREQAAAKLKDAQARLAQVQAEAAYQDARGADAEGGGAVTFRTGLAEDRAKANVAALQAQIAAATKALNTPVAPPPASQTPTGKSGKPKSTPRDQSEEAAAQIEAQIADANRDVLRARLDLATGASERAALERRILAEEIGLEAARIDKQIASINDPKSKGLDAAEKQAATLALEGLKARQIEVANLQNQAITREEQARLDAEALDLRLADIDGQGEMLSILSSLATTAEQRRVLEYKLLDLADERVRIELEGIIASKSSTDAEKALARKKLDQLSATRPGREAGVIADTRGPLERFMADNTDAELAAERFQALTVGAFDNLADGLAQAIVNGEELGDVAKRVFADIISELLASSLKKNAASLLSVLLPGGAHASGTNFAPGGLSLVGERGPELVNLPRGSQVIPNHKLMQMQPVKNGGGSSITYAPQIVLNAQGAGPREVDMLKAEVRRLEREMPGRAVAAMDDHLQRTHRG